MLEAKGIFNLIGEMREKKEYSEVAVLYKILGPSKILLGYLLNHKIPFTAQIKVPRKEDPIVGLCLALLEVLLNVENIRKKRSYNIYSFYGF